MYLYNNAKFNVVLMLLVTIVSVTGVFKFSDYIIERDVNLGYLDLITTTMEYSKDKDKASRIAVVIMNNVGENSYPDEVYVAVQNNDIEYIRIYEAKSKLRDYIDITIMGLLFMLSIITTIACTSILAKRLKDMPVNKT